MSFTHIRLSTRRIHGSVVGVVAAACLTVAFSAPMSASAAGLQAPKNSGPQKSAPAKTATPQKNPGAALKNPIAMSDASVKAGRAVYAKLCRNCHGLQGKGDGISAPPGSHPANLVDSEWKYGGSDGEIFYTIKNGVKPFDVMEPWGKKFTDTEIWNTVNFLRDLGAKQKPTKK